MNMDIRDAIFKQQSDFEQYDLELTDEDLTPEAISGTTIRVWREIAHLAVKIRNQHMTNVIGRQLQEYEVGALIVGKDHLKPGETPISIMGVTIPALDFDWGELGTMQDYFRRMNINVIYITDTELRRFYEGGG